MYRKHLGKIHCIDCGGGFEIICSKGQGKNIKYGILKCKNCGAKFPIINFIPRLLKGELLKQCLIYYFDQIRNNGDLYDFYNAKLSSINAKRSRKKIEAIKLRTQKQFGYEWQIWKRLPAFAENHFFEIMGEDLNFFKSKIGWDPAVGMGRDLFNAAKAIGQSGFMIGSDISFAVDAAYERCKFFDNVLIVEADLYTDFVKDESLDFACMIGLIQHLTQPKNGIEQVFKKVKKDGYFVGTVYTEPNDLLGKFLVNFINFMRFFTLRLPLPIVLFISRICAIPAYILFKLPFFILKRFKYIQNMNKLYPTHKTQKRKPNLDLLAHNWFDHFTPSIIGFYSHNQIMSLIEDLKIDLKYFKYGIFRFVKE